MSEQNADIATNFYSLGNNRLLCLPSFFCDSCVLKLTSNTVDADLYRVGSIPPLSNTDNFTGTKNSTFDPQQNRYWQYYLYQNSTITLSVHTEYTIHLYTFKGKENANYYKLLPMKNHTNE